MNIIKVRPLNWLTREDLRGTNAMQTEHPATHRHHHSVNPWGLHREIDKLFEDAFRHMGHPYGNEAAEGVIAPRVDIYSAENAYIVNAELPGIEEKDIELEVHENVLSIKAKREQESKDEKNGYYSERHYGMFQRMLQLPEDIDAENITAKYKNGVLNISVARKTPPKDEVRKITISGN